MPIVLFKNPEIKRNSWLDFSLQRLVAMPLIIGLILFIAYWDGKDSTVYNQESSSYEVVNKGFDQLFLAALVLFFTITVAWGSKNANNSILEEYNNRTWDWQRGHNLSPWEMTLGKLFGSTLYNWYGGICCLGAMVFSWPFLRGNQSDFALKILVLIVTALSCHAISMILALLAIRKSDGRGKIKNGLYVFVVLYGFFNIISPYLTEFQNSLFNGSNSADTVDWYGISINLSLYHLIHITIVLAWSILGLYRNFRTEYQYLNGSFVWIGFLAYLIVNQLGTSFGFNFLEQKIQFGISTRVFISCLYLIYLIGILSYAVLILEPKNFINWKKFLEGLKSRNWKQVNHHAPLWLLTYVIFWKVIIFTIGVWVISGFGKIGNLPIVSEALRNFGFSTWYVPFLLVALPLFMARDFSIMLYLHAAPRHKRALGATLLYLFILYILTPILLYTIDAQKLIFLFLPFGEFAQLSWISALIQTGIIFFLLSSKFRKRLETEIE